MTSTSFYAKESEHTPPSAWCPHPERWTAPDGGATEYEVGVLLQGLVRAIQPIICVEVGAYLGHTSAMIGAALAANGYGMLDSIEPDLDRFLTARERCQGLPVFFHQTTVPDYRAPGPIGLLYLDGDLASRPAEVEHFAPYMEQGGLIVVHDTAPHHQTPDQIRRLVGHHQYLNLRTPRGVLILQVDSV